MIKRHPLTIKRPWTVRKNHSNKKDTARIRKRNNHMCNLPNLKSKRNFIALELPYPHVQHPSNSNNSMKLNNSSLRLWEKNWIVISEKCRGKTQAHWKLIRHLLWVWYKTKASNCKQVTQAFQPDSHRQARQRGCHLWNIR